MDDRWSSMAVLGHWCALPKLAASQDHLDGSLTWMKPKVVLLLILSELISPLFLCACFFWQGLVERNHQEWLPEQYQLLSAPSHPIQDQQAWLLNHYFDSCLMRCYICLPQGPVGHLRCLQNIQILPQMKDSWERQCCSVKIRNMRNKEMSSRQNKWKKKKKHQQTLLQL